MSAFVSCSTTPPPRSRAPRRCLLLLLPSLMGCGGPAVAVRPPPSPLTVRPAASFHDFRPVDSVRYLADERRFIARDGPTGEHDGVGGSGEARAFVVSIRSGLPGDLEARRDVLVTHLRHAGLLDEVFIEAFDRSTPTRLNFAIGRAVPAEAARAALLAFAVDASLPVYLTLLDEDHTFGNHRRVYIGSHVNTTMPALSPDDLALLTDPDLTPADFWSHVEAFAIPPDL